MFRTAIYYFSISLEKNGRLDEMMYMRADYEDLPVSTPPSSKNLSLTGGHLMPLLAVQLPLYPSGGSRSPSQ